MKLSDDKWGWLMIHDGRKQMKVQGTVEWGHC